MVIGKGGGMRSAINHSITFGQMFEKNFEFGAFSEDS